MPLAVILVSWNWMCFKWSSCSVASSELWEISVLSVLKPLRFHSTQVQAGEVCFYVFALRQTCANNLHPTNQCPHSLCALLLLSSHTPVATQQHAITTLCAVKHTHSYNTHPSLRCPPAAMLFILLSTDESLSTAFYSALLQGRQSVSVSALCFLRPAHKLQVLDNELLRLHSQASQVSSVTNTSFVKPGSQFSTDLRSTLY